MDDFYGGDELADMKFLPLFFSYGETLASLTDEQFGKVVRAALAYMQTGTAPQLEPIEALAFEIIKRDAERSADKYEEICQKRREAADKRWERYRQETQPDANASKSMQMDANADFAMQTDAKDAKDKGQRIKDKGQTSSNDVCAEPSSEASTPSDTDEVVSALILNDGTMYHLTESMATEYERLYPAVNIRQEFRNMAGWCDVNPMKRKTRGGVRRFVNSWLAREQNRFHNTAPQNGGYVPQPDDYPF